MDAMTSTSSPCCSPASASLCPLLFPIYCIALDAKKLSSVPAMRLINCSNFDQASKHFVPDAQEVSLELRLPSVPARIQFRQINVRL
jgi:hypothetical protein